jgi:hypothetical protein
MSMDDGPEWFAPKRYGYGSGPPISWQGWVMTLAYVAIIGAIIVRLRENVLVSAAIFIPLTIAFCVVCARTTRGGWRWRWGDDD